MSTPAPLTTKITAHVIARELFPARNDPTPKSEAYTKKIPNTQPSIACGIESGDEVIPVAARDAVDECGPHDGAGVAHFLMLNADNLYPAESVRALVELGGPGLIAYDAEALSTLGNIEPSRVQAFALLDVTAEGALREIVEKPDADHPLMRAGAQWVSMNLWRFTSRIFDDCAEVRPSVRGEFELADAVRAAIARGERLLAVPQRLAVLDLSRRGDVAALETRLAGHVPSP